mgnify:FL=1
MMEENNKIDFVVLWVDSNDPLWQEEKNKYQAKSDSDSSKYRYRDWDLLQYWFRGVEKFTPWVNKVHFVTYGHIPKWLNLDNPKLNVVRHQDFIPEKYLPTFSSHSIECNIHRIKGLSENFVYFNDDFYIIKDTKPKHFFKNGLPCETIGLNVHCPKKNLIAQKICFNDTSIINEHFDFKKSFRENIFKWLNFKNGNINLRTLVLMNCPRFPGFWQQHIAEPYSKETFKDVWNNEYEILDETCTHKFRESSDINQWLFKEWQIASGKIAIRSKKFGKSYFIDRDGINNIKEELLNAIQKQKYNMIAINDGPMNDNEFENLLKDLKESFNKILPEKSTFEK